MYIPLATDIYILDNDYCRDQYSALDPEDMGMNFYIDDSVICAGMPPAKQSKMKDQNNDACAVRFFSVSVSVYLLLSLCLYAGLRVSTHQLCFSICLHFCLFHFSFHFLFNFPLQYPKT